MPATSGRQSGKSGQRKKVRRILEHPEPTQSPRKVRRRRSGRRCQVRPPNWASRRGAPNKRSLIRAHPQARTVTPSWGRLLGAGGTCLAAAKGGSSRATTGDENGRREREKRRKTTSRRTMAAGYGGRRGRGRRRKLS